MPHQISNDDVEKMKKAEVIVNKEELESILFVAHRIVQGMFLRL